MRVLEQAHSATVTIDGGDGASSRADCRTEDLFRRATFRFAQATKGMVESAVALGPSTKVPISALEDIELAVRMLRNLYIPPVVKIPVNFTEGKSLVTAAEVQEAVSTLADKVANQQVEEEDQPVKSHRGVDLSAPVISKNGKMRWALVDCPVCPSKVTQRCQKPDGGFVEKPHQARKDIWVE